MRIDETLLYYAESTFYKEFVKWDFSELKWVKNIVNLYNCLKKINYLGWNGS
jgi:uncharacterized radical SAM superfamily Fe-S cluster-containing enzyme